MNGLPYYKAYPRDFFDGTAGMCFETKAAYRLVLDMIYMHGGRLVDDPRFISGHLGCSVKKWNNLRAAIIATGKISVSGGYLGNLRADKEVDATKSFLDKQRKNGSQSRKNNSIDKAVAKPTHEPKPSHTDTYYSVSKDTGAEAPPTDPEKVKFDVGRRVLCEAGKTKDAAGKLLGKWRRDHGTEAVIAAIGKAQREGAIDPASFIEGCLRFRAKRSDVPEIGTRVKLADGRVKVWAGAVDQWVEERG